MTKKKVNEKQADPQNQPEWVEIESASIYVDIIRLSSNERHFIFNFAQSTPGSSKMRIVSKITLHPKTAGELLAILTKQVSFYEKQFNCKIIPGTGRTQEKVGDTDGNGNPGKK